MYDPCDDCEEHICGKCTARDHYQGIASASMRLIEAINDAVSILDSGSNYERLHVSTILRGGLEAFEAQKKG